MKKNKNIYLSEYDIVFNKASLKPLINHFIKEVGLQLLRKDVPEYPDEEYQRILEIILSYRNSTIEDISTTISNFSPDEEIIFHSFLKYKVLSFAEKIDSFFFKDELARKLIVWSIYDFMGIGD